MIRNLLKPLPLSGAFVGMELGSRACMFLPVGSTSGGSVGPLMILPWPFLFPEPMITIIIRVCSNHLQYVFFPMIFCCASALSEVIHDTLQKHRRRSTDWSTGNQGFNPHTPVIAHRHSYGTSGAFMDNLPTIATKNVDVPLTMVIFLSIQHGDCPLTMLFFRDFPWLFRWICHGTSGLRMGSPPGPEMPWHI